VATLGYSRRAFVAAFDHERQSAWLEGLERAFRYFGDRARTQGKDERGVGYVKRNAIAGRTFTSRAALEAHLSQWPRTVADGREHGTTGEPPLERFQREEAAALRPVNGRPPFHWTRELTRQVQADGGVEVDTHHYSVPWRLIGETVTVRIVDERLRVTRAGREVAQHPVSTGRRQRVLDPAHLAGVVGAPGGASPAAAAATAPPAPALLRPLAEYEAVAGGGW
jgi:transposase